MAKKAASGTCTPWDLWLEGGKAAAATPPLLEATDLELFNMWCIANCQQERGQALSAQALMPAQSVDEHCSKWKRDRLNGTMGITGMTVNQQQVPVLPAQTQPPGRDPYAQMSTFVQGLTHQFATAVQPIADAQADVARKRQETQRKEGYTEFHVALILGYSNVYDEREIAPIWRKFQTSKTDWKGNRDYLKEQMMSWSSATGNSINIVPQGKTAMDDIASLECAPGGATGNYEFLERGNSPLLCQVLTVAETKEAQERDIANEASAGNRTLSEALSLGKGDPRAPPRTFEAVQKMVATYAAKNYVLWGNRCGFYLALMDIVETMKLKSVVANAELFKMHACRQIVWAIYDDMSQYFLMRLTPDHFARSTPHCPVVFPRSRLASMLTNIVNGQGPYRLNFPYQWKAKLPENGNGGGQQPRQQGSQQQQQQQHQGRRGRGYDNNQGGSQGYGQHGGNQNGNNYNNNNNNQGGAHGGHHGNNGRHDDRGNNGRPHGQNGGQQQQQQTTTHCHHRIAAMMRGIWQMFGKVVRFTELMRLANIRIGDLPTMDRHVGPTGNNRLCFNYLLGHCPHFSRGTCTFDHVLGTNLANNLVDDICRLVTPGWKTS